MPIMLGRGGSASKDLNKVRADSVNWTAAFRGTNTLRVNRRPVASVRLFVIVLLVVEFAAKGDCDEEGSCRVFVSSSLDGCCCCIGSVHDTKEACKGRIPRY